MSIYDLPTDPPQEEPKPPAKDRKPPQEPSPGPAPSAGSIYGMPGETSSTPTAPETTEASVEEPKSRPRSPSTKELAEKVRAAAGQTKPTEPTSDSGSLYDTSPASPPDIPAPRPSADEASSSEAAPPKKRRRLLGCGMGCLVILLLPVLLGGLAVGVVAWKWSGWVHEAVVEAVQESGLSDEEKNAVVAEVDRLYEGYRSGEINKDQVVAVATEVAESPLLSLVIVYAVNERYLSQSGLAEPERDAGYVTLQRVAQGFYQHRISRRQLDSALDYISVVQADGNRQFHSLVTDDDLRAMLAECRQLAETARIPTRPAAVDVARELQQAIDRGLAAAPQEQLASQ